MPPRKRTRRSPSVGSKRSIRASVSLPPTVYRTLEAMAKQKKVSTAWVLRDAAERYVADHWPLLEKSQ
jgi:hypothetical protein